jgi:hypothetical protein
MTIHDIPREAVDERPAGYREPGEQAAILQDVLAAVGVDLGDYDRDIIHWVSFWDWSTIAVIASWVARGAATRESAAAVALPSRFDASPAEVDRHLRSILADDVYLRYQQIIGGLAVNEAATDVRLEVASPGAPNAEAWHAVADYLDLDKGGNPHPAQLQCSQHDGFGPCPGAPRCTPRDTQEAP